MTKPTVFISHSHADNDWSQNFAVSLRQLGFDVWIDKEGISLGDPWFNVIERELIARDIFVVILSNDARTSQWVQREIQLAMSIGKRIIPLVHKSVQLSGFITLQQYRDVVGQTGFEVAQTIGKILEPAIITTPPKPTPAPQNRYTTNAPINIERKTSAVPVNEPAKIPLRDPIPATYPRTQPVTILAPKTHPVLISLAYGFVAALIGFTTIILNKKVVGGDGNGLLGFCGSVFLPIIALYLGGHYAGRHQRLNHLQTSVTSGIQSVISGTGAGITTSIVYVTSTMLSALLNPLFGISTYSLFGSVGAIGGFFAIVVSFIVWLVLGLLFGTFGGLFGDSRAHQQLRAGAVPIK